VKSTDLAADYKIEIGGSPLDPKISAQLIDLRVETTSALPDVCTLRFSEGDGSTGDALTIIDNPRFALGSRLTAKLSGATDSQLIAVFDGEITTIEAELGSGHDGRPVLELLVTGHDRSHRMHRVTTTRTLRQVTVTDVARKLAQEHGLRVGQLAPIGAEPAEVLHQVGETDWSFLSGLVSGHGGELDVAAGALNILDPTKPEPPVAELFFGQQLQRFRPRMSSVGQVATVEVHGWDPKGKREIVQSAVPKASTPVQSTALGAAVAGSTVLIATMPVSTTGDVKARAGAIAARLGHERVQGEATATGDPRLVAGAYVDIKGVGTRFGGTHRIVSAVHVFGARGYQTRLTLGAGGRPLAEAVRGGSGAGRGFADHLAIAIVTSNDDPDKLGRVKVQYPTLGGQVESGWARVVRGASGRERGAVALPHVTDEVVVGFHHGDVRRPFVLGALFNGNDTPGADLLKTTSSLAARFPRDLDVATKEKVLVGADTGLTVKSSQGPIEISAGKEFKLAASAGGPPSAFTIETTGEIKMDGKQGIQITATGPLKISGQAPVTVESTAALQLKGSVVQVQATGLLQLSGASVMIG